MNRFCIIISLIINISCSMSNNDIKEYDRSTTSIEEEQRMQEKLIQAINKGDLKAYNEVSNFHLLNENWNFFYYSFLMANKYNCPEAHYHIYVYLTDEITVNGVNLYSDDKNTRNIAYYHLLKSHELGFDGGKLVIDNLFGSDVPSSSSYLLEMAKE